MANINGLLLTLLVGFFFLSGILITKRINKKQQLTLFAIGMAFIVIMGMIFFDIIPEIKENVTFYSRFKNFIYIFILPLCGMGLLKLFDHFIPHHHHEHKENEKNNVEHNEHLFHIGFITSLSLILHNIIEGMSIYATSLTDFKTGLMMSLAVSLHNIPLGIEIAMGMGYSKTKKKTKFLTMFFLTISSFLGAFILFLLNKEISKNVLSFLLCVTFGMLLYIAIFELLKEIWMNRKEKFIYYGMGFGVILTLLMVIM